MSGPSTKLVTAAGKPPPSRRRKWLFRLMSVGLALLLGAAVTEVFFRVLERRDQAKTFSEGEGGETIPDPRWGWKPTPGWFRSATPEFDVTGEINALHMNDRPHDAAAEKDLVRVLVLGDSHTYAVGVSQEDAWPRKLESLLNAGAPTPRYRTYNAAYPGYSVHQYLLRLIDQGPVVKPHYVVVGFSYATDLYDLLPPEHGGWIYGGDMARDYFDLDADDNLAEKHWDPAAASQDATPQRGNPAKGLREFLDCFATFRYLRRSNLSLWVGSRLRLGGKSLWPNMEVVVEKEVSEAHAYQWRLVKALMLRLNDECRRQGATLFVVGIPYLPQVYDEIWEATFGGDALYERDAAIRRFEEWCQSEGIVHLDTCPPLRARVKEHGRWIHHRRDAHPTAEGHEVIARTVFEAGVLKPRD